MDNIEYRRLLELKDRVANNKASSSEKKEYMNMLFQNGNITKKQYDDFLSNQNSDQIIGTALTIGGVLLVSWLLGKLFDN